MASFRVLYQNLPERWGKMLVCEDTKANGEMQAVSNHFWRSRCVTASRFSIVT
jgi:hypothetical protein